MMLLLYSNKHTAHTLHVILGSFVQIHLWQRSSTSLAHTAFRSIYYIITYKVHYILQCHGEVGARSVTQRAGRGGRNKEKSIG